MNNLKKLNRFSKYRAKYSESLTSLASGTESAQQHVDLLQNMLATTVDPDLRQEIQKNLVSAQQDLKSSNDTILANKIKLTTFDQTPAIFNDAIKSIQDRKAMAVLNGNEEEATSLDLALATVKQQQSQAKIQDITNDLTIKGISKGFGASSKIDTLNGQINAADASVPVTIGGKKYASEQAYWTSIRDGYLAGNGSGMFTSFFDELGKSYQDQLTAAINKTGVTNVVLDSFDKAISALSTRPEMQPYLTQVDQLHSNTLGAAIQSLASVIVNNADYTGDFKTAADSLTAYGAKYGIDTSTYSLALGQRLTSQINAEAARENISPDQVAKREGLSSVLTPDQFKIPQLPAEAPAATPTAPGTPATPTTGKIVQAGDTLSKIATQNGMSLDALLALNPKYKANPNMVNVGDKITLTSPTAPSAKPATAPVPTVVPEKPGAPTVVPPPAPTTVPVAPAKPVTPVVAPTPVPVAPVKPAPLNYTPVPTSTPAPVVAKTPNYYVVKAGDTLSSIAQTHLGDASKAFTLKNDKGQGYDANTAKSLAIGTKILLP